MNEKNAAPKKIIGIAVICTWSAALYAVDCISAGTSKTPKKYPRAKPIGIPIAANLLTCFCNNRFSCFSVVPSV